MRIRLRRPTLRSIVPPIVPCAALVLVASCSWMAKHDEDEDEGDEGHETRVALTELSAPARATVERLTAGGKIESLAKETERGKLLYDVEATVGGKHVEYAVADADGAVIGTETSIDYAELPAAVRAAAEKFFDGAAGLKAMKGVEYGETTFEIEGPRKGKTVEATFDPEGKQIE